MPSTQLVNTKEYKQLSNIEQQIALSFYDIKIKDVVYLDLKVYLLKLIFATHLNVGYKAEEEIINLSIDDLCNDLKSYNAGVTLKQIEIAFRLGIKNEYSEWFGLCNKTYFQWINGFVFSERKRMALLTLKNASMQQEKEVTEAEANEIIKNGVIEQFENYKAKGIFLGSDVSYNYLERQGLLILTAERKKEIFEQIKLDVLNENKRNIGITDTKRVIMANIENMLANNEFLKAKAKKYALKEYFDNLIEMETDLKDLIR